MVRGTLLETTTARRRLLHPQACGSPPKARPRTHLRAPGTRGAAGKFSRMPPVPTSGTYVQHHLPPEPTTAAAGWPSHIWLPVFQRPLPPITVSEVCAPRRPPPPHDHTEDQTRGRLHLAACLLGPRNARLGWFSSTTTSREHASHTNTLGNRW